MPEFMDRRRLVLAALSARPDGGYAPVQVQKLFFLIDEHTSVALGGKQFHFEPYNYGPYDADVYRELEALERDGHVLITGTRGSKRFILTPAGLQAGKEALDELPANVASYFGRAAEWVKSLSFAELVGAIYKAFPTMRERSIFVG